MSLSCSSDCDGDYGWWWTFPRDTKMMNTKRSRRCCSCGTKLQPGDEAGHIYRNREPISDIEERIYSGDVPMATWYVCETCHGLGWALYDLGFVFTLGDGDSIQDQIAEYRKAEAEYKAKYGHAPATAAEALEC